MTGDQDDVLGRLKALLPAGWFADSNPILDGLLSGFAYVLALGYSLLAYAKQQTRISTATDGFLDLASYDFFGTGLPRKPAEQDNPFRARIKASLLAEKGTRPGMIKALTALTGRPPVIFEPARPADTGAVGINCVVNGPGAVGTLNMPYQCLLTAFRPISQGGANLPGLNAPECALNTPGRAVVASFAAYQGQTTDDDIYALINEVKPEGTVIWTLITN